MQNKPHKLNVCSVQLPAVYGDIHRNTNNILKAIKWAEKKKIDIICFPECYLQGYLLDVGKASKSSIDLNSGKFKSILSTLKSKITLIVGLIEKEDGKIFNTAVVIKDGKLVGKYSKNLIMKKESFFDVRNSYPIFSLKRIKYGINICFESRFSESSDNLIKKGAKIIFCPLNNSLPHKTADKWRDLHIKYFVEKAKTSNCWIVTSDVIEKSDKNTGYGFTAIIDPHGKVLKQVKYMESGRIIYEISF